MGVPGAGRAAGWAARRGSVVVVTTSALPLVLPLARAAHDRAAARRAEPDLVPRLLATPSTRVLLVHRGRLAVATDHVALLGPADVAGVTTDPDPAGTHATTHRWLYLGRADDGDVLALVLPDDADAEDVDIEGVTPVPPAARLVRAHAWKGLRELGAGLDVLEDGLAAEAVALAAWHAANERCPRCGEQTAVVLGGWVRHCPAEGVDLYPRTDPAVIMAVVDADDRLLLGHAAHWPDRRFSTLAGYVEPGEGLEQAVRREVAEETGVVVGDVLYRGSQPWPFPASLMLGFRARATTTAVTVDGVEVTEARWFTRDGLAADVDAGRVLLPGRQSIARALVEEWFGAPLPGE